MEPAYFGCIPITNPGFAAVSGKTGRQVSRGGQWRALGVGGYTWGMDAILCLDSALEFYHISRMADRRPECVDPAVRAVPLDLPRSKVKSLSGHTPTCEDARLQAYLANAAEVGAYGAKKALAAMPYVLEGAASPRELSLALNMTLPRSMGGYALPKPLLNCRIDVDKRIRTAYGKDHFTVDACWVEQKLVVEYDSDAFHLDPKRRAHDNDRRAMLGEMGYRVLPISSKQQDALVLSDNAFRRLGKLLGVKDRSGESRYDWQARRSALRRTLRELETRRGGQTRSDGLEEWR